MQKAPVTLEKTIQKYFKIFAILLIVIVAWRGFYNPDQALVQGSSTSFAIDQNALGASIQNAVNAAVDKAIANAIVNKNLEVLQNSQQGEQQNSDQNSSANLVAEKIIANDNGFFIFIPKNNFSEKVNELTIANENTEFKIIKSDKKPAETPAESTTSEEPK